MTVYVLYPWDTGQQIFPTPYECVEHLIASQSIPCTVSMEQMLGAEEGGNEEDQ